jgi:hypothetical protein
MNVPIKLTKMSQTFAENKINAEENEIKCCICYDDNSEEGNKGKLIECCPNKHILCIECFHKSYERKCECPLCCELMFRPEIMTDVESFAYYGAKLALKQKEREEERLRAVAERQREIRLSQALSEEERLRAVAERQRKIRLAQAEMPEAERQRAIAALNDRRARGLIRLAEAERQRDDRYARGREERQRQEDVTRAYMDSLHIAQQPVARPVQQPVTPVAEPVAKNTVKVSRIQIAGKSYLKTSNNLLYNPETKEEVGIWDPDTRTIQPLPEDDDSEDEVLPAVAY